MKTELPEIIVVAYHMGRIGSSSIMGLLKLANINVGRDAKLARPGPMNPKGFFELKSHQKFLKKVYNGYYPNITDPPDIVDIDNIGKNYFSDYEQLIKDEFREDFPIAIKSQRFLTLPFLNYLKNKYKIYVIIISRNLQDQINSTLRVWNKYGNSFQKAANQKFIAEYITKWKNFSVIVEKYYDFPYYHMNFEELINNPLNISEKVFSFIQVESPGDDNVLNWIDKSLVNRPQLVG